MSRRSPRAALRGLLERGPWVDGSAHGYPNDRAPNKFGEDRLAHCLFCYEDYPFHREYCPWQDYFHSPYDPDPMDIATWYDEVEDNREGDLLKRFAGEL